MSISVLIPVYNGELYLEDCLQSVADQSYPDVEIIVVNDGSQDRSEAIARSFDNVKYFSTQNFGVSAARNRALEEAKHPYIAFLDQDDIWPENSLKQRMEHLKVEKSNIVIGRQRWFLDGITEIPPWVRTNQLKEDQDGFLLGCALINKALFNTYGGFDVSFKFAGDYDWFFRLKDAKEPIHQIEEVVLKKRIHANNETRKTDASLKELSRAVFNSIQRKRTSYPD